METTHMTDYIKKQYTTSPSRSSFNTLKHLRKGQRVLYEKEVEREKEKVGHLRGGSSGAIIGDDIYGNCHRKAHLRLKGISSPLDEETELMTKQGEKNEDIWIEELRAAGLTVMTQDEVGLELEIKGSTFTGSPDILITDNTTPLMGLELKNLSSGSKAVTVNNELVPDTSHLIQASTYSFLLGKLYNVEWVPYQLIYSSRSVWHVYSMSEQAKKHLQKNPRDVNYSYGRQFKLVPFHRIYDIRWNNDKMEYWTDGLKDWVETPLTKESILYYYDVVANKIEETKHLGPRPTSRGLHGKATYSPCNYCSFSEVCDEHEDNYEAWIQHAQVLTQAQHEARIGDCDE